MSISKFLFTLNALCLLSLVVPRVVPAQTGEAGDADTVNEIAVAVEAARLAQLLEDYFEEGLQQSPILATSIGDSRYNDRLPNFLSEERQIEDERLERRWLAQIQKIDRELLNGQDRLSYDVFTYDRETAIEGEDS